MRRKDATTPPASSRRPITQEQIAALAFAIWQDRGRPEGSDIDNWLEAERQLKGEVRRPAAADDIPADPQAAGNPDADPALRGEIARKLDDLPPRGDDKPSATSL